MTPDQAQALRAPFSAEMVGLLPRATKKDAPKGQCNVCKGWHGLPAIHLDYVGHGAVTARLLEVDPEWNWEPVATDEHGLPVFDTDSTGRYVGLWIKLTVGGVSRLGYGSVPPGTEDAAKQLIGDALRNAAIRFGVALDLWIKGHAPDGDERSIGDGPRSSGRSTVTDRPSPSQGDNGPHDGAPAGPVMLNDSNRAKFVEGARGRGLDDADIARVVERATEGRTSNVEELYHADVPALRAVLAEYQRPAPADDNQFATAGRRVKARKIADWLIANEVTVDDSLVNATPEERRAIGESAGVANKAGTPPSDETWAQVIDLVRHAGRRVPDGDAFEGVAP